MPIEIVEIPQGPGVLFSCRGVVTSRELIDATRQLLARPSRLAEYHYGIVDHTEAAEIRYEPSEMQTLAAIDLEVAGIARRGWPVVVVAPEDLQFGFSRMWQMLSEGTGWRTHVFRTLPEAETWLRAAIPNAHGAY